MRIVKFLSFLFVLFVSYNANANNAKNWLDREINIIISAYQNSDLPNENKFLMIEQTINNNFAGTGIAKFVAGKSWGSANKDTKKAYVKIFKKHLALNIASMMQGYSDQDYIFTKSVFDDKNKVNLIDMEIISDTGSLVVTWRLKKSKEKYYVIDLLVADISLIVTKRSEFNSMIKKVDNSLEKFIDVLKKHNELSFNKLIN